MEQEALGGFTGVAAMGSNSNNCNMIGGRDGIHFKGDVAEL